MDLALVKPEYDGVISKLERRVKMISAIMFNGFVPFLTVISATETIWSHIFDDNPSWHLCFNVS